MQEKENGTQDVRAEESAAPRKPGPRKDTTTRLGTESIVPLLFKLAAPSIIGMAVQALYNVVDTIYVGHVNKTSLSALSLAFPIQMILIAIAVGTGVGTNSLISRRLGEGKPKEANNVAEHVFLLAFVYAIIIGTVGAIFYSDIVRLFTRDPELIGLSGTYIRIIMIGSGAMFIPMITNNILRGEGNTFLPMLTLLIGAVINIGLDPVLIYGLGPFPELGVAGAAYATVFSRFVSGVFIVIVLLKGDHQIKLRLKDFKYNGQIIKDVYKVGFPAMLMQLLASFMIAGMNKIVVAFNVTAVAVVGVFFRLQSFILMPVFGLNQGYIPVVGYNFGHRNPERMKKAILYGMIVGEVFTIFGFLLFQIIPRPLMLMFNKDPELVSMGVNALRRISIAYPLVGAAIVGSTTFQAVGKGFPSLVLSVLRQLILFLPLMYIIGRIWGMPALWLAFPISAAVTVAVMFFWLRATLGSVLKGLEQSPPALSS